MDFVDERADEALAAATTFGFPSIAGKAQNFTRVNPAGTALEFRTPAQVRSDIGAQAASELVGMVAFFGQGAAPTGWLKANGAAVSRTAYASLFSVITTTYGVGDGATTFNLPDLRGEFPRGWDDGRGIDSGRALGSAQGQQARDHSHRPWNGVTNQSQLVAGGTSYFALTIGSVQNIDTSPASLLDAAHFGSETRPRNVALLACIRY